MSSKNGRKRAFGRENRVYCGAGHLSGFPKTTSGMTTIYESTIPLAFSAVSSSRHAGSPNCSPCHPRNSAPRRHPRELLGGNPGRYHVPAYTMDSRQKDCGKDGWENTTGMSRLAECSKFRRHPCTQAPVSSS